MHEIIVGDQIKTQFPFSIPSIGFNGSSKVPLLDGCRELIAAGVDPTEQAIMTRNGTICLKARIGVAAKLTVQETGGRPRFVEYRNFEPGAVADAFKSTAGSDPTPET